MNRLMIVLGCMFALYLLAPSGLLAQAPASASKSDSAQTAPKWELKYYGGYFQFRFEQPKMEQNVNNREGFFAARLRPSVAIKRGQSLTFLAEAQVGDPTISLQAYADIRLLYRRIDSSTVRSLTIRVGQFPSEIALMTGGPRLKPWVNFGLMEFYTPVQYVFGMQTMATWGRYSFSAAVIDGSAMNKADNNEAKDIICAARVKLSSFLNFRSAYQTGYQPNGWRSAGFIGFECTMDKLGLSGVLALHNQFGITERGWETSAIYDATKHFHLVGRAVQRTQHAQAVLENNLAAQHSIEWTTGIEALSGPLKFQVNGVFQGTKAGLAAEMQVSVP
ncbi:MAG: hypothetical protein PHY34_04200 [Patescibacteria group bacterium]|nr:hypothetical protein [Patescibacteria group bacterium]MDD5715346.1 hypothetical protein [Patescibacteria group bacterium]